MLQLSELKIILQLVICMALKKSLNIIFLLEQSIKIYENS